MKPELDKALCEKYPKIFARRHDDLRESAMGWGFECGDGWYWLLDNLCSMLMWDNKTGKNLVNPPVAIQVKEKFGSLRFYVDGATEAHYNYISFAESLSCSICETCGTNKNTFVTKGWLRTTCQPCEDARQLKRKADGME